MSRHFCPACGTASPSGAKFCSECGGRLARPAAGEAGGGPAVELERRQVTVMFCDLVGSTQLSLQIDAEDFTAAVSAYRDTCARIVRHWGGYISRYVGDGVLVYFGYPRASADDAMRGVAAAWELARAVPNLRVLPAPSRAAASRPVRLAVRIGLHTGLAVMGEVVGRDTLESDSAMGAVPNLAARLQGLATAGEVVVSETTAALLPKTIELRALEPATPQRDLGTMRAFTVAAMPPQLAQGRPLSAGPLVGRQGVLERLLAPLCGAAEETSLLLYGEPGVGKSRLAKELVGHEAMKAAKWIWLSCTPYGQMSPLHPFRNWIDEPAPADVPATPYDARRRIFDHLGRALLAHAPWVGIVLEDIHWADSTTIEFVGELLPLAAPGRLTILLTSRQPPQEPLAIPGRLLLHRLERLDPGDTAALARALCGERPLSALELAGIVEHADGVPLYVEEFVRALRTTEPGPDNIPITLRDSLMSVLDTLGTGRTVALCASVFGRRFEYGQLRQLLALEDEELLPAVQALTQAQVLVQSGDIPAASFEFRHALVRDTAYHTLLKSERARWHRRLADLAAAGTLAIEQSMPELLAIHHSLGGNYEGAIAYWLRAQERAMQRSANVEALGHIRSGLDDCRQLAAQEPSVAARLELELLRKLTAPLIAISGWSTSELEEVYGRAMQLCGPADAEDAAFELERGLYNLHLLRSQLRTADAYADRLMATASACRDPDRQSSLMLVALRSKALPAFYGGDEPAARGHLERVLALHDPARHAGHAFRFGTEPAMLAHSYLAWMDAARGDADRSARRVEQALARARAEGHAFSLCYALCFAASCAQLTGRAEVAGRHAAEACSLGQRHNFAYWIAWARAVQGWVCGLHLPCDGIAEIDEARRDYEALGSSLITPYFDALACDLARHAGLPDHGEREARLHECARSTGLRFWEAVLNRGASTQADATGLVASTGPADADPRT